jgi:hypothetical protein
MSISIEISKLLATFPAVGFTDRIDVPIAYRPRRVGHYVEKFVTDEKFTTITKSYPQNQLIRSISWDKYKCSLIVHEGQNIENIDVAGDVTITLDDGSTHTANIIEFSEPVNIGGSDHRQIDFVYYDTNLTNYLATPINDFLKSGALPSLYTLADINTFVVGYNVYYTVLNHKKVIPELDQDSEKINGIEKVVKSNYQSAIKVRLYVTEAQAATIAANCPQLGQSSVLSIVYNDKEGETAYPAIERIIPEISMIDYDLYQVDIILKHINNTVNHF